MKKTVVTAITTAMILTMAGTVFAAPQADLRHPAKPLHTVSVPQPVNPPRPVLTEVHLPKPVPPQRVVEIPYIVRESDTTTTDRVIAITDCILAVTDVVRQW